MKQKKFKVTGKFSVEVTAQDKYDAEITATNLLDTDFSDVEVEELEPAGEPEELSDERGAR